MLCGPRPLGWPLALVFEVAMSSPAPAAAGNQPGAPRGEGLFIELSAAQVDAVVRAASHGSRMLLLLSGWGDVQAARAAVRERLHDDRLCSSLLSGLLILVSFPADGSYLANAKLARSLGMNVSTAHRYVSTLVAVGLLERDAETRRYRRVR